MVTRRIRAPVRWPAERRYWGLGASLGAVLLALLMALPVSAFSGAPRAGASAQPPLGSSLGTTGCGPLATCSNPVHPPTLAPLPGAVLGPAPTGPGPDAILASVSLANDSFGPSIRPGSPGTGPDEVAFDSERQLVFVVDSSQEAVSVYNANLTYLEATIPVGSIPFGIVYAPDSGEVLVANFNSNSVTVINDTTLQVVENIPIGDTTGLSASGPTGLAYDPDLGAVFVTSRGHYIFPCCVTNLTEIDPIGNSIVGTVQVQGGPIDVQFDPSANALFVENEFSETVSVVNASTLRVYANLTLGIEPTTGIVDPSDGEYFVAGYNGTGAAVLAAYDDQTLAGLFTTAANLQSVGVGSLVYDAATGDILAAMGPLIEVVNPSNGALLPSAATGTCVYGVAYAASEGAVYATDYCADRTFSIGVSTYGTIASIRSGGEPTSVFVDPGSGDVWTNDVYGQVVRSLDGATMASGTVVPSGTNPTGFASDPSTGSVVVLSDGGVDDGTLDGNASYEVVAAGSSSGTFISLTNTSDPTEFPLAAAVEGPQGLLDVSELVVNGSVYELAFRQYDLCNGSVVGTTNLSKTAGSFEPSTATAAAVLLVPGTSIAVVTDPAKATVYGVDTANGSVTWSTALIGHATAVAYDPETGTVLVATTGASSVVALDPRSGQVNATTLVEENATGLAYDPLNNRVYVSENDPSTTVGGQVESFNASTLFDEELVAGFGADLRGVAFLPASGLVGVAGSSTALLYLLGQQLATPSLHTSAASTILTQSVTLTASAADGFAPYNYTYTGLPPGCTSANTSALVCMPTRAGSYTVFVHILDLTGATVSASVGFVVLPPPVVAGIDLASGAPASGTDQSVLLTQNVSLTAAVTSSGVAEAGPTTILNWTVSPITNGTLTTSHSATVTVSFFDTGNLTVILTAFFDGTTNSSAVTFDVGLPTHSTSNSGSGGLSDALLIGIALVVVAVVVAAVALVLSRRGKSGGETSPAPEAAEPESAGTPPTEGATPPPEG
jgi:YVTN family beta-propeller protein